MIVPLRLLRAVVPLLAVLVAQSAFAQTSNDSGGGVISDNGVNVQFLSSNTQYANLSLYDCQHSTGFNFQFSPDSTAPTAAEFVLSTSNDCETPNGATIAGATTCTSDSTGDCPSLLLQNSTTLTGVVAETVTDFGSVQFSSTPTLNTGGMWSVYTRLADNPTLNPGPYSTTDSENTSICGPSGGVDNALLYICVLVNAGTNASGQTVVPYGSISIALDSISPPAIGAPTVTPLDSGLHVSWTASSTAFYYYVHVSLSATQPDGGSADAGADDAGTGDGGLGADVVSLQPTSGTSMDVTGLQNGVEYDVYVVAADDSGTSPPTTSNLSDPSPVATGIPVPSYSYFQEYKAHGGTENGCSSGGLGGVAAGVVLVLGITLLRRRRQRRAISTSLIVIAVLVGGAGVARAEDPNQPDTSLSGLPNADSAKDVTESPEFQNQAEDDDRPVQRQASKEWFRIDVMTGPFNPNPDQGLPATPSSSSGQPFQVVSDPFKTVFPAKNQLLWQLQFHVNFYSGFGHLSAGIGAGLWQTSGHSLLANGTAAGDTETFTLYPITPMIGYRADFIYTKWHVPLVPYAKVGFGFVPFVDLKDGKVQSGTNADGTKWTSEGWAIGPQWAVGLEFPLEWLDPQHGVNLDEDFGINSIGLMGEFGWNYWTGLNGGLPLGGWVGSGGLYIAF